MPTAEEVSILVEIESKDDWYDYQEYGDGRDLDIGFDYDWDKRAGKAVLNLNTYISRVESTDNPISDAYNCGREGCFAGWYCLLGESEKFLDEAEMKAVGSYDLGSLSRHFGISYADCNNLFSSLGKGIEGFPEDVFDDDGVACNDCNLTRDALIARGKYLEELFKELGIDTAGS